MDSTRPRSCLPVDAVLSLLNKGGCPPLTPELATELAQYRGWLSISGLQELSPQSAAALVSYRGPRLELSGPATDKLFPETATALANLPGTLDMPLEILDSVPLAEKHARQSGRTLDGLEAIGRSDCGVCEIKRFFSRSGISLFSIRPRWQRGLFRIHQAR